MIESGVASFVLLLIAAAVVAILVGRLPIPYVTALAVVGAVGGALIGPHRLHLDHSLILFVLVPGLLFEAAFNLDWRHLRDNLLAVIALATNSEVVTTPVVVEHVHVALSIHGALTNQIDSQLQTARPRDVEAV